MKRLLTAIVLLCSNLLISTAYAEMGVPSSPPFVGGTVSNLSFNSTLSYTGTTIAKLGAITGGSGYTPSGVISTLTLAAGSGYTDGTYTNVALTGGTGTGATCTLFVFQGAVISCTALAGGTGYTLGDVLSASGIGSGTGLSLTVATTVYANVPLTGGAGTGATANIKVSAGGVVNSVSLVNHGTGFAANNALSAAAAGIGGTGSGFSVPVSTVGLVSSPSNTWLWASNPSASDNPGGNSVGGICADTNFCTSNLFVTGRDTVDATAASNGYFAYTFLDNLGGTGTKSSHHTMQVNLGLVATPDNEGASRFYTALNVSATATAGANGTSGTPAGNLFAFNPQCLLGAGALYFVSCVGEETDLSIRAGASAEDLIGHQVVLDTLNVNAASRFNSAFLLAAQNNTVIKLDRMLTDGAYSGFPGLSSSASWFSCFPTQGSGNCGSITNFADLSKYTSITGKIINGPAGTFYIDGSFNGVFNSLNTGGLAVVPGQQAVTSLSTTATTTGATINYAVGCGISANQNCAGIAPYKAQIKNMTITTGAAPGAGQTYTATLLTGTQGSLSATSVTCTISGASAKTCSDSTDSATLSAGTFWSVQIVGSAGVASSGATGFGFEMDASP